MLIQDTVQQYLNSDRPDKLLPFDLWVNFFPLISELLADPTQLR